MRQEGTHKTVVSHMTRFKINMLTFILLVGITASVLCMVMQDAQMDNRLLIYHVRNICA
jgi:hypothetical protein